MHPSSRHPGESQNLAVLSAPVVPNGLCWLTELANYIKICLYPNIIIFKDIAMTSQWGANTTAYLDRPTAKGPLGISLEMFPPPNAACYKGLRKNLRPLLRLRPDFVSVTSGAGGSGSRKTLETITSAQEDCTIPFAAHLTCIGKSHHKVHEELDAARHAGIRHFVALRGDFPESSSRNPGGYQSALELVRAIRARPELADCSISVAAYPEGHPEANSLEEEVRYLKRKVEAGADRIITQFFFDTEVFSAFMERVQDAGINVPVLPGILPIANFQKAVTFAEKCHTRIPRWYHVMYRDLKQDGELHKAISVSIAVEQCRQLMALGVKNFHFYTLNRSELTLEICRELGQFSESPQVPGDVARSSMEKPVVMRSTVSL